MLASLKPARSMAIAASQRVSDRHGEHHAKPHQHVPQSPATTDQLDDAGDTIGRGGAFNETRHDCPQVGH